MYNNNKEHVDSKGNIVAEKIFDENFVCPCRRRCTIYVPLEERKRLFKQFWSMGTFAGRCVLLITCISKNENRHTFSIFGRQVCKVGLMRTLQISEGRITVALTKMQEDSYADIRGLNSGGRNALPVAKKEEVCSHISSFPKYVSHYTRNQTDSKYLNANLSLAKLYRLYKEKFPSDPVSESFYKKVFYQDFNLRFKTPKKDTCNKCDTFIAKIKTADQLLLEMLKEWHNNHLEQAELLQLQMKSDLKEAKTNPNLESATYDIQKILQVPRLSSNKVYYKRQLNLYNLGIHVGSTGKGLFHLWHELEASKGTQEVGSCLKKFIESVTRKGLRLWSDCCGGQNRSIRLILMIIHALQQHPTLESISMRYLETGHTFLPNDSEFGDVECALKRYEKVCTDVAYMKIMEECRTENKFIVHRMTSQDFFSVKEMENVITNRKVDINKEKISWLLAHEILLEKNHPKVLKIKRKVGDEFQVVNIAKTGMETDFKNITLGALWPNGRTLSKEKINDLKSMLDLIDDEDKYFYSFLDNVQAHDFIDDVDGFAEVLDFELQDE